MAQIHQLLLFEGRQGALGKVTSKAERRLVDLAAAFLGEENPDITYTHPGMCLTVLPHRATGPDGVWCRSNSHASLEVHPLRDADGLYHGVPYGPKARLMLLFLQGEALKTRSRFVELGRSMRQLRPTLPLPGQVRREPLAG